MTTYYVGSGGNDGNAGTAWATRFLTLGKAATTVAAGGDKVYVAPGTYREQLTVGVSGGAAYSAGTVTVTNGSAIVTGSGTTFVTNTVAAGDYFKTPTCGAIKIASVDSELQITLVSAYDGTSGAGTAYQIWRAIEWIGDYSGANTDGVGGVVRITGSADDITAARTNCIVATSINYNRIFGFTLDIATTGIALTTCQGWVIERIYGTGFSIFLNCSGATQLNMTIQNCYITNMTAASCLGFYLNHSATVSNANHVIQNCIVTSIASGAGATGIGIAANRVGGVLVRNCYLSGVGSNGAIAVITALAAGQVITVLNCIIASCFVALIATTTAEFVEDYNNIYGCATARTNVNAGANSVAYPPLFDTRWFFEMTK